MKNSSYSVRQKVVGYIRVSTEKQTEKYGILRQKEAIEKYCEQNELELVRIYTDAGISGAMKDDEDTPAKREQLITMLDTLMGDSGIEQVVVIKVDRLWRNSAAEEYICKRLRRLNVDITSIEESDFSLYIDDPVQKFMNRVMAAIAEYDYDMILKRLTDGQNAKAIVTGTKPCGRQPFGYKFNEDKSKTVLNTTEAPIVKEIFRLRLEGATFDELEEVCRSRKYVNRDGRFFTRSGIRYIIHNPYYCGILMHDGKQIAGKHTPIVSREDWIKLNKDFEFTV